MVITSMNYTTPAAEQSDECRRIWLRERADGSGQRDHAQKFLDEIKKDKQRENSPLRRLMRKLGAAF